MLSAWYVITCKTKEIFSNNKNAKRNKKKRVKHKSKASSLFNQKSKSITPTLRHVFWIFSIQLKEYTISNLWISSVKRNTKILCEWKSLQNFFYFYYNNFKNSFFFNIFGLLFRSYPNSQNEILHAKRKFFNWFYYNRMQQWLKNVHCHNVQMIVKCLAFTSILNQSIQTIRQICELKSIEFSYPSDINRNFQFIYVCLVCRMADATRKGSSNENNFSNCQLQWMTFKTRKKDEVKKKAEMVKLKSIPE